MDLRKEKDTKGKDGEGSAENLGKGSKKHKKAHKKSKEKHEKTKASKELPLPASSVTFSDRSSGGSSGITIEKKKSKSSKRKHHHRSKKNAGDTLELKKSERGPDEYLPLVYDTSKKLDEPPPPPEDFGWKKAPPRPPLVRQDVETEKKRDEAIEKVQKITEQAKKQHEKAPKNDLDAMIGKLTDKIDEMIGKGPPEPPKEKDYHGLNADDVMLKLGTFSIPQQDMLLRLLYSSGNETRPCHFGGNMWDYYSNVLRCFTPINMQGRYRGAGLFSKSMTAIDVNKLKLKSEETEDNLKQRDEMSERAGDEFASVAVDAEHYLFLRQLWNFHPSALPVSHTYQLLCTLVPILQDMYYLYSRRIGVTHPVTVETHKRWEALKSKLESYIKLLLEPIETLLPRDPRFSMNEEELLNIVKTGYMADEEVLEKLKHRVSFDCLRIPNHNYHDLVVETLEYRQKVEDERCGPYGYDD